MPEDFQIIIVKGDKIFPYISDLAALRIEVFKNYPYLYEGNIEDEKKYLKTYMACSESVVILVSDNNKIVGASTAIPLKFETEECKKPFLDNEIDILDVFYFGESVLLPAYRGKNIYQHFFRLRELAAAEYGCKITAFCAVERSVNDVRRPKDYIPLDKVWEHFGYRKHPELCAYYKWKEIGDVVESENPLIFWLKNND